MKRNKGHTMVLVDLEGNALDLVLAEKKRYRDEDRQASKSKIINRLLTELYNIKFNQSAMPII